MLLCDGSLNGGSTYGPIFVIFFSIHLPAHRSMRLREIMNKVWMDFLTVQPGSGGQILVGSGLQSWCQDGGLKKSSVESMWGNGRKPQISRKRNLSQMNMYLEYR